MLWSKKFKNRYNSASASQFFDKLSALTSRMKVYTASNKNGEYGVRGDKTYYFYDFVIPEINLCIEFNGDYWHCNPAKYKAGYLHKQSGRLAEEIWQADAEKHKCLLQKRNIETMIIWESDNINESINKAMEKINECTASKDKK